ncbi:MAG: diphosphate--fructose-6-phosphate 1-phosphotransferase [Candidatus Krumholzibacteriia bacterium]
MTEQNGKVAILAGGGPAPGINSVIAAASIRAILKGYDVIGIHGGFRWIMRGDISQAELLNIDRVSRIHFRGGSIVGTARDNPTTDPEFLDNTVDSLDRLGVDKLITIGGDDTAFSAMTIEKHAGGRLRVVHVPKTIDNDLDLPHGINTFGYQTARHVGAGVLKNLMIDARTTGRWYFVLSMGRKAGHLALGIGKAAGATVTIIPEEFDEPTVPLRRIVDILAGTIIKRRRENRSDGVAVLAEGLMERLDPGELEALDTVGHDEHGHVRLGEIQFAPVVKQKVLERLEGLGISAKITTKDIGYELRGAEPIPYDMEYTRDLGFCAAQYIINGGTGAMVSIDTGRFNPLHFDTMLDHKTKRTRVRMVDVRSEYYYIARRYMLRLKTEDFRDQEVLGGLARVCGLTVKEFRKEFEYLVNDDLLVRIQKSEKQKERSVEDVKAP